MYNIVFYNEDMTVDNANLSTIKKFLGDKINVPVTENTSEIIENMYLMCIGDYSNVDTISNYNFPNKKFILTYLDLYDFCELKPKYLNKVTFDEETLIASIDMSELIEASPIINIITYFNEQEIFLIKNLIFGKCSKMNFELDGMDSLIILILLSDGTITQEDILNGISENTIKLINDFRPQLFVERNMKPFKSLDKLKNGSLLFNKCSNLKQFNYELPSLIYGTAMFFESGLKKWNTNLPSLRYNTLVSQMMEMAMESYDPEINSEIEPGDYESIISTLPEDFFILSSIESQLSRLGMFAGCSNLTSFIGDCESLIDGRCMFGACENLREYIGSLPSLKYGSFMFSECKLNPKSTLYILNSIPLRDVLTLSSDSFEMIMCSPGIITIGIDATEETKDLFAQEIGFDSFDDLTNAFTEKKWLIEWEFNGENPSTYSLRAPKTKKPVYVKISEINKDVKINDDNKILKQMGIKASDLEKAYKKIKPQYQSEDGKFYNMHVISDSNNLKGYTRFDSLEDALEHYKLTPYVEN